MIGSFELPQEINLSFSTIYGTIFQRESNYFVNQERFVDASETSSGSAVIARNSERIIINFRIEKSWMDDKLNTYLFGNDIFNDGIFTDTIEGIGVTRSLIARMVGGGISYKFD